jgi:heme/copper-type cytochrome/quinol oxidase subunit 2
MSRIKMATPEDEKKRQTQDLRTICKWTSIGIVSLAVIVLLIVFVTKFLAPSPQAGGRKIKMKMSGGNCGCMAGQV